MRLLSLGQHRSPSEEGAVASEHRSFHLTTNEVPEIIHHVVIRSAEVDGTITVTVTGNLDTVGAPELATYCSEELAPSLPVRLDLAVLDFIDSAGLSALVQIVNGLRATGRSAVVVRASGAALSLFDLTGLREPLMSEAGALPGW